MTLYYPSSSIPTDMLHQSQSSYLAALREGSGRSADKVVEAILDQGLGANDIYLRLFQPTAYEIGRLWQRNEFSVAQEHLATAIIERQMGNLHSHFQPQAAQGHTIVIGCVDRELHRLGSRMVADFFEQAGWQVYYLGASVPTDTFVGMLKEVQPDIVGLSSQMVYHLPTIQAFGRSLDAQGLGGLPILVGGLPFVQQPELYRSLGVHAAGQDAADAVRCATALLMEGRGYAAS